MSRPRRTSKTLLLLCIIQCFSIYYEINKNVGFSKQNIKYIITVKNIGFIEDIVILTAITISILSMQFVAHFIAILPTLRIFFAYVSSWAYVQKFCKHLKHIATKFQLSTTIVFKRFYFEITEMSPLFL